jgi:3-oxoadipate enol-lactonase
MPRTGLAPSGSAKIYYESIGTGRPVVFIHAGIADSRMWTPQFESVPDGFRFIRLDLQGFGRSEFAGEKFSNRGDVLAVLDHLSIETAVVVGCSMGGATALGLAQAAPGRVSGLVLIGAGAPGFEPPEGKYEPPQWPEAVAAFKAGDMRRVAELDAEMWVVGYGRSAEEADRAIFEYIIEMDQIALSSEGAREEVRIKPDVQEVGAVEVPALVLVGEHDLPDLRAAAVHLAEMLSDQDAVVIEKAAHLPSLERPDLFNAVLEDWLRRL